MEPPNLKPRLATSYDTIATTYNAWTTTHSTLRLSYLSRLLGLLPPPQNDTPTRVLELGCGAGIPITSTLVSSTDRVFHVTANDLSPVQIALAKQNLGDDETRVTWKEGDMMALEFDDGAFDAVIGLYSLIHLPRKEQEVMMGRIGRWVKKGGLVLLTFGGEETEGVEMERWLGEGGWMFWSSWGVEGSLEVVKRAGFEVLVNEVKEEEGVKGSEFLWVVGRRL
ncbi:hypothetical protein OQA88_5318 [Cercophora sp. LCS_1]